MNIVLQETDLPKAIVRFLERCRILTFEHLLQQDEDALMKLAVVIRGSKYVLSRKQLHVLKEFISIHAPSRIDADGCFCSQ